MEDIPVDALSAKSKKGAGLKKARCVNKNKKKMGLAKARKECGVKDKKTSKKKK